MSEDNETPPVEPSLRERIKQELDEPNIKGWPRLLVIAAGILAVDTFTVGLNVYERLGASAVTGVVIYFGIGKYINHRESDLYSGESEAKPD